MANETEYRLFVPTTDNSGHPIRTDLLQSYAIQMADHFGGVTVYPASGCYHDEVAKTLRCDPVIVITATEVEGQRRHSDAEDQAFVRKLSIDLGRQLGQRDVLDVDVPEAQAVYVPGRYRDNLPARMLEPGAPAVDTAQTFRRLLLDR